ncbi:hypothetical protein [Nocardia nepalensis]|uniref:hypothetical protein n=1 Tax=Nocardia nepalensis TaxID=3375448 RepID=UPI003B676F68
MSESPWWLAGRQQKNGSHTIVHREYHGRTTLFAALMIPRVSGYYRYFSTRPPLVLRHKGFAVLASYPAITSIHPVRRRPSKRVEHKTWRSPAVVGPTFGHPAHPDPGRLPLAKSRSGGNCGGIAREAPAAMST